MESNTVMENTDTVYQQLFKEFFDKYVARNMDLVTVRTIKIEIVIHILKELNLPLKMLNKLFKTHTVIHDEFMNKLLEKADEDTRSVLAQKFVKNEKLVRILKDVGKENKFADVESYLGLDGLHGNLTNGPNFEYKHYLSNLIIPNDPNIAAHLFDDNPDYKRKHVYGVRAMYQVLKNHEMRMDPLNVYLVMSKIAYDSNQMDLPKVKDDDYERLDDAIYKRMEEVYLEIVDPESIQALMKSLRYRGEKRSNVNGEDETSNGKRKSVEREMDTMPR